MKDWGEFIICGFLYLLISFGITCFLWVLGNLTCSHYTPFEEMLSFYLYMLLLGTLTVIFLFVLYLIYCCFFGHD